MTLAAVSELKASLSEYLRRVKAGEDVVVTDRGRPIARLSPISVASQGDDQRLDALERSGVVRRGAGPVPDWLWAERPLAQDPTGSVGAALLDERDQR